MAHRFRFLARHLAPKEWQLAAEEWHHLLKVLRLPEGSELELADGAGWVALSRLTASGKHEGVLEILEESFQPAPCPDSRLTLALGALKPQSVDELLPFLIELGVDSIEVFSYSAMDKSRLQDKVRERWERIAVAAMKQCKRPWSPQISWSASFDEFLVKAEGWPNRIYLDPDGEHILGQWRAPLPGPSLAVIGGEKGLDPNEVQALKARGFQACRIEGAILRATTAAIATAAILRQSLPQKAELRS